MKNTKIKKYSAGDILLQEGEYNKTLHKILSGKVALYLNYGKSNEYLIETLTSPHYFGEVSILIRQPCYSTAVAIEDTTILHIASENFEDFITNNVRNAFLIMNAMAKSLSSLNALLHKIEHGDHPYAHDDTEHILSGESLLTVPSHKHLFMDSPAEEDAFEQLQSVPEGAAAAEPDEEINQLIRHALETSRLTRDRDAMVRNIMQNMTDESTSSYADYHNILPEVYPDFYLPGHRCYPDITHPEYEEFTFQKEYVCPHCKHIPL